MRKDSECPYCEEEIDLDNGEGRQEDEVYEDTCPHCYRSFVYTISYSVHYYPEKAACLNGEPHDFQPIHGSPKKYFEKRRRCSMCSKEITLKEEAL